MPAPARTPLLPILSVTFVGTLGFSIVLPFLVYLVTRLGGNALIYGITGATYSFFQLIGAPILGRWSDRWGRKRVLLLSQLGTFVSWGIFLVALRLPATIVLAVDSGVAGAFTLTVPLLVLLGARALDGLTGGNVSVANAYLADITAEADRAASFGKMSVASNLGFIVGPALAGLLGATALGETLPVTAAFVISGMALVLIAVALPAPACGAVRQSLPKGVVRKMLGQEQRDCYRVEGARTVRFADILRHPRIRLLLVLQFLVFLAFNVFYVGFPVYAASGLRWSLTETGMFFSVLSLLMVLVQGPVLARASRRWSNGTLVIAGSALLAVSFLFFVGSRSPVLYAGAALLALGNGLMWPSLLALLSSAAEGDMQGATQGIAGSAAAIASIVGLFAGGVLFGLLGRSVFVLAAVITGLVALVALGLTPPRPAAVQTEPEAA